MSRTVDNGVHGSGLPNPPRLGRFVFNCGHAVSKGHTMPDQNDALTRLVQEHVGDGRPLTIRAFAARAVDSKSGTRISKSTAGNLVQGHQIKITPEVLGAIAAGLGVNPATVRAAAVEQYVIGAAEDPFDTPTGNDDVVVRIARDLGAESSGDGMPATRAFIEDPSTAE